MRKGAGIACFIIAVALIAGLWPVAFTIIGAWALNIWPFKKRDLTETEGKR